MTQRQQIQVKPSALKRTRLSEYVIRFVFGGLITAITGLIAHQFGPVIGGLFLAFPAILPASATLIERHSGKDKAKATTGGSSLGAVGLLAFGAVVWATAGRIPPWGLLAVALVAWFATAAAAWFLLRRTAGIPGDEGTEP